MDDHRVFTWDPDRFADPAELIGELGRRGMRCVTIVDPGVKLEPGNAVFDSGLERDAFVRDAAGEHVSGYVWPGRCVLPDFLRRDVRDWWGGLHTTLVDAGVAGIWNDMNEPALYAKPVGTDADDATLVEVPADAPHGPVGHRVGHADVHDVYGVSMVRAASDALARLRPDARSPCSQRPCANPGNAGATCTCPPDAGTTGGPATPTTAPPTLRSTRRWIGFRCSVEQAPS